MSVRTQPGSKAAMDTLVENLRAALRQNIAGIAWMGDATKARQKLGWQPTTDRDRVIREGIVAPAVQFLS